MSTEKNTEHFEDATCSAPYATATCVSLAPECTSSYTGLVCTRKKVPCFSEVTTVQISAPLSSAALVQEG